MRQMASHVLKSKSIQDPQQPFAFNQISSHKFTAREVGQTYLYMKFVKYYFVLSTKGLGF